ncbi:proline-rich receptor-like protein kinase PERK1 isoform X1 [Thalassophryne amazonica]|uniref:proline-rich receptor-like protein kinase PERK1 isoform X1 n=1 Tax=Thalassophryne amazonica TaxID=390379 RepID=UPI00147102DF|nr:proline-rich receptor-like protein kinase PERK1 isoform X1 [Thalassophryne amazonica]
MWKLNFEEPGPEPEPGPSHRPIQPKPAAATAASHVPPAISAAPILMVVLAQPQAPSIRFTGPSCSQVFVPVLPPPALTVKPIMPKKSERPCGACQVPQCGGQRKRYMPSKEKASGSSQKIFTFCPATNKSIMPGFEGVV